MSRIKQHYFFGLRGRLEEKAYPSLLALSADHHHPPRVEKLVVDEDKFMKESISSDGIQTDEPKFIWLMASDAYHGVGRYGFFGDFVCVSRFEVGGSYQYFVDEIGQLSYEKPGLAADILPFIRDIDGNLFFVCIRKEAVGQGAFVLVGGFVDSAGLEMETSAQAAIRESGEEITLKIRPSGYGTCRIREPFADDISVIVEFCNGEQAASTLKLVKTCFTSTSEREIKAGSKRVHMTTAYSAVVEIRRRLSCEEILSLLEKGSDATEVIVLPESAFGVAEFGAGHHRELFDQALSLLRR